EPDAAGGVDQQPLPRRGRGLVAARPGRRRPDRRRIQTRDRRPARAHRERLPPGAAMTEITTDAPADVYVNAEPAPEGSPQPLTEALARVRRRTQLVVTDRWLVIAGGILMPLGVVLVFLGWYGASHTTRLF